MCGDTVGRQDCEIAESRTKRLARAQASREPQSAPIAERPAAGVFRTQFELAEPSRGFGLAISARRQRVF